MQKKKTKEEENVGLSLYLTRTHVYTHLYEM